MSRSVHLSTLVLAALVVIGLALPSHARDPGCIRLPVSANSADSDVQQWKACIVSAEPSEPASEPRFRQDTCIPYLAVQAPVLVPEAAGMCSAEPLPPALPTADAYEALLRDACSRKFDYDVWDRLAPIPASEPLTPALARRYLYRFQVSHGLRIHPLMLSVIVTMLKNPELVGAEREAMGFVLQRLMAEAPAVFYRLVGTYPAAAKSFPLRRTPAACSPSADADSWELQKARSAVAPAWLQAPVADLPNVETLRERIAPAVVERVEKLWLPQKEGFLKKALLYIPRLGGYWARFTFGSRTAKRVANLALAGVQAVMPEEDRGWKAYALLSNSVVNVPGTAADLISDLTSILNVPRYATTRLSDRVRMCTVHLGETMGFDRTVLAIVTPSTHVALDIDDWVATADSGAVRSNRFSDRDSNPGGGMCAPVPVYSGESDSLLIERIQCLNNVYSPEMKYEFYGYNCGGYTKDLLDWSGSSSPIMPNAGIGAELKIFATAEALKHRAKKGVENRSFCEEHLTRMRRIIVALEAGVELPLDYARYLAALPADASAPPTADMMLQLVGSAARGRNPRNREYVEALLKRKGDWTEPFRLRGSLAIKEEFFGLIREMLAGLSSDEVAWVKRATGQDWTQALKR